MDLRQQAIISLVSHLNETWEFWKNQCLTSIEKHDPMKTKRNGNRKSPWIAYEFMCKTSKTYILKTKAERPEDQSCWADS